MKNIYLLVGGLLTFVLLTGCSSEKLPTYDAVSSGNGITVSGAVLNDDKSNNDNTIEDKLITLTFKGEANPDAFVLDLNDGQSAVITIQQPNDGTIYQIDQIQYPDGSLEGPFGPQIEFVSAQDGKYRFSIMPNLMAGTSQQLYSGDVMVQIQIITQLE